MLFIIIKCFLVSLFFRNVLSAGLETYLLVEPQGQRMLCRIPNHPDLKMEEIDASKNITLCTERLEYFGIKLKENINFSREKAILICYAPPNFKFLEYSQFYNWISTDLSSQHSNLENFQNILFYLNFFKCMKQDLIFKLYKILKSLEKNITRLDGRFFKELWVYPYLTSLFIEAADETREITFKRLYYYNELETVLVQDEYIIENSCRLGSYYIKLSKNNRKQFISYIEFSKYIEIEDKIPKIQIYIESNVVKDAIERGKVGIQTSNQGIKSFLVILTILEALEFLVVKNTMINALCSKARLTLFFDESDDLHMLDTVSHIKIFTGLSSYSGQCLEIHFRGYFCDANDILNLLGSEHCKEFFLMPNFCRIKSMNDILRISKFLNKIEVISFPQNFYRKIIKRESVRNLAKPIFSKVLFVGDADTNEAKEKYTSLRLERFWGPIRRIEFV